MSQQVHTKCPHCAHSFYVDTGTGEASYNPGTESFLKEMKVSLPGPSKQDIQTAKDTRDAKLGTVMEVRVTRPADRTEMVACTAIGAGFMLTLIIAVLGIWLCKTKAGRCYR